MGTDAVAAAAAGAAPISVVDDGSVSLSHDAWIILNVNTRTEPKSTVIRNTMRVPWLFERH